MHSMAQTGQSPADARAARDSFVGNTMVAARAAADSGDREGALKKFGEAMHPVMDSSSPMHTDANGNPKVWSGIGDAWGHSPTYFIGNETSVDLTLVRCDSQSVQMNSILHLYVPAATSTHD